MAPEQFEGKARFANDQYSLAVMVYEWLSGTLPFHGNFLEIFGQHITGILPPPLSTPNLAIPFAVEQVVFKALSKDYHNRFADIMTFAQALEQSQHTVPFDLSTPATQLQQPFTFPHLRHRYNSLSTFPLICGTRYNNLSTFPHLRHSYNSLSTFPPLRHSYNNLSTFPLCDTVTTAFRPFHSCDTATTT